MNAARRRTIPDGLPNRVYLKSGSWYWFPKGGRWIKLCRIDEGETKMLKRLAAEKEKAESQKGLGNTPALVDLYVKEKRGEHREKGWWRYGEYVKQSFIDGNVEDIDVAHVAEFLRTWANKIPMQRTMRAFLSGFFQWCRENRHYKGENPCAGIRLRSQPERDVYITDEHFAKIRGELSAYPMILAMVDLCYLTLQRSTEVRALKWRKSGDDDVNWIDREKGVIHFLPSKTQHSSGMSVEVAITPDIESALEMARVTGKVKSPYVLHTRTGRSWSDTAALEVWRKACNRAGLQKYRYTIKDIRAKAITDAADGGYTIEQLRIAAVHTKTATTQIYFKGKKQGKSEVRMTTKKSA
jgi:integrase